MTEPKLEISDLTAGYGVTNVLNNVSLSIGQGEVVALMGRNGMGKTTLLQTLMGHLKPRKGEVLLSGVRTPGRTPAWLLSQGIGYAPQEQPLFTDLSIHNNLRLAVRHDRDLEKGLEIVRRHFPFFLDRLDQKAGTLSGGEQKMLILSRALMSEPSLLLVDEISEGVQPSVVSRIASSLREEAARRDMTILIVEQNLHFAMEVADRWAVMKLGEIVDEGICSAGARDTVLRHLSI